MYNQEYEYMPYMQMMGLPAQYCPMMTMPQQQLETMYPKVYYIVYPAIQRQCDMMGISYGSMFTPTREQLEAMVDSVYKNVEASIGAEMDLTSWDEKENRQFFFSGRRLLRDLITILLIRELLFRRRPFFGGFGGFGGYPGY